MMRNKITLIMTAAVLTLGITACDNWLDVNYDPRNLTDHSATVEVILPPLLERCASVGGPWVIHHWMGYWSHWNMNENYGAVNYKDVQATSAFYFNVTPPAEISYLEKKAKQSDQLFYWGIAKVVKALKWSQAVDMVNNMPYEDAYNVKILQPRYSQGEAIYEDLIKQLDSAAILIKTATSLQSSDIINTDIMFHGDKAKWAKLINTVKLRLLIHQANRTEREQYILSEIQKIVSEGSGFLGSGEDASVNPSYSTDRYKLSRYFGTYSSHNFQWGGGFYDARYQFTSTQVAHANVYALELLKSDNDPRIGLLYSTIDNPFTPGDPEPFPQSAPLDFRGNKFGLYIDALKYPYQDPLYVSAVGGSRNLADVNPSAQGIIKGKNMSDWVLTSVESMFLQAEAVQRNWIAGDAEQAYLDAVTESFRWLNAGGNSTDPSLSDEIFFEWYNEQVDTGNDRVSWAAAPDKYKLLMYQKYMALNGIESLETWNDYRRNGRFPDVPLSAASSLVGDKVPIRLLYNQDEYRYNTDHVKAQGPIDMFSSKIWWMPD
jgi:hypothetical protein